MSIRRQTVVLLSIIKNEKLDGFFKHYTPPIETGYTFAVEPKIQQIKNLALFSIHSQSAFEVCSKRVKAILNEY